MKKFNSLKSIPAYLPIVNIDTDMIIPKQFLKTIKRTGLGKNLFFEIRYDNDGKEIKDFVLNQEPYNKSNILITGKNFGCGSSREHAPWALADFGITCIISSSYADIFYNNCFKNGILPIVLEEEKIKELSEYSKRKQEISIDLKEMEPIGSTVQIQGDFTEDSIQDEIKKHIQTKIDVVMSDMAVNTTGIKNIDSIQTGELCKEAMLFAKDLLTDNGYFISKIFMGGTFNEIVAEGKNYFKEVKVFKPKSSRKDSKESFIICRKLR